MIKDLDKKNRYVVACSFGPDSMALLNMLYENKFDLVVAHVNYHKRDVSNFEEQSLKKYCLDRNIPIEVLDTINLKCDKNFQEWAREIRYHFFADVLKKYNAKAVLVAHQEDDLIETFLMQEKRGGIVKYSGIAEKTTIFGVDIIRPLLSFGKQDLLLYDNEKNVPYSIDVSNLSDDYQRNKIRHNIVEKMTKKERDDILKKIRSLNSNKKYKIKSSWILNEFLLLSNEEILYSISEHLNKTKHIDLSSNFIHEIRKAFESKKPFIKIRLVSNIYLVKDYDLVYFSDQQIIKNYKYILNENSSIDDELFNIDFTIGKEERNISNSDYPLTIKPLDKEDYYDIKTYQCDVRRLFIDWKMPHRYRDIWPGIYNKDGKLIYIPRYRRDFKDNHQSKFVIKFTKID